VVFSAISIKSIDRSQASKARFTCNFCVLLFISQTGKARFLDIRLDSSQSVGVDTLISMPLVNNSRARKSLHAQVAGFWSCPSQVIFLFVLYIVIYIIYIIS
jgi:hypothetical protein